MRPNLLYLNNSINAGNPIDKILKLFDINFTRKDFEVWQKDDLIEKENIIVDLTDDEEEDESSQSLYKSHEKLYGSELNKNKLKSPHSNSDLYDSVKDDEDEILFKNNAASKNSTILKKDEEDIEKLKKEILGDK